MRRVFPILFLTYHFKFCINFDFDISKIVHTLAFVVNLEFQKNIHTVAGSVRFMSKFSAR